jgi:hypothetical protein
MHLIRWSTGLALVALVGVGRPGFAQSSRNHLYDKLQLDLSGAAVILGSNVRVDGSNGNGTDLDAEDNLGLAKTKFQPRGSIRWRPGRRHQLELGYQFARRTAEKTLERDIVFADSTYPVGLAVNSKFDTDQAFLTYRFAFLAHDRTQIGVGVGLGALFFKIGIDALAAAGSSQVTFSRAKDFIGPTASLGLFGDFRLADRWYLESDLRAMKVSIDRIDAKVWEANLAARYFLSDKVGLEAGYGISWLELKIASKTDGNGLIALDASGKIKYYLQNLRLGVLINL